MQNLLILCKIYFSIGWNIVRCIGNSVFYRKCTKLIVSLICVSKPKTTLIMKQREYIFLTATYPWFIYTTKYLLTNFSATVFVKSKR